MIKDFISNFIVMSIYLDFYLEVFMHLFQEVGSEVIEAWKAYKELWVFIWILGFSSFYLEIFMLFGCFFGFWMFLSFILLQDMDYVRIITIMV
jgi:hypothetical protein